MAFLDNSGDIILDAVLTKIGREKLSSGTGLGISQFALGDDEINYALYDKSHASGSAYYDLEIMQTPILEGFTQINANINYGLLSYTKEDLLYLPEMLRLEKETSSLASTGLLLPFNGIYYFAVNVETLDALRLDWSNSTALKTQKFTPVRTAGADADRKAIFVETGFSTSAVPRDDRSAYTEFEDLEFTVSVDSRFISAVDAPATSPTAYANSTANVLNQFPDMTALAPRTSAASRSILNYVDYEGCKAAANLIVTPTTGGNANKWTNFDGAGLNLFLFSFGAPSELRTEASGAKSTKYTDYGTTGRIKNASGVDSTDTYNYIDTMVQVTGETTSATLSIPVRIIRYAST